MSINLRSRFRSLSDISMRHRGTYIAKLTSGVYVPYFIEDIQGDLDAPILNIRNVLNRSNINISMISPDLMLERPEVGNSNILCPHSNKLLALWSEATAARQTKRSLDFSLITTTAVNSTILNSYVLSNIDINSSVNLNSMLSLFYNNNYPSYHEALDLIRTGQAFSVAFSKKFSLSVHPKAGIVLYYKKVIIGFVSDIFPILLNQFTYLEEFLQEYTYVNE